MEHRGGAVDIRPRGHGFGSIANTNMDTCFFSLAP